VIKPGDPVLRVATDASITRWWRCFRSPDQAAALPAGQKIWHALPRGRRHERRTYQVRLVMHDEAGRAYPTRASCREQAATLRVTADKKRARPGEAVEVRARPRRRHAPSSRALRRVAGESCDGIACRHEHRTLTIPEGLAPGRYGDSRRRRDLAQQRGEQEVSIDIIP